MKLDFRNTRLEKNCATEKARRRAFGADRAKRLGRRLSVLIAATTLGDLRHVPGHFHELHADRAGQFAADLDGPYRLIFEPVLTNVERRDHDDGLVWSLITHVRILSIEDYHG